MNNKKLITTLCFGLALFISGCSGASGFGKKKTEPLAASVTGFNHTQYEIARFSINGGGGSMGGSSCCVLLPEKWSPHLVAKVKWESLDTSKLSPRPKFSQVEAYKRWKAELRQYSTSHEITVPIPEYEEKVCSLDVHFLPCHQVKVTTSCASYGSPNYPINEPFKMKEPAVCPK
ncbi:DUF3304 domain-containing protein [Morganella psychrotolerans]|uniref:DUF3304 domain-containing protein n=1 Tax=Morganella psychrotolerans TaxID=368603 RepID=A0A5M9QYY7_9GAMM|nr:DUF3304 domain-containing protein [Morganella psychrotolerans]KAA8713590.1 DUF3304 domain-containing protein [Morganella psychrotolerans]OBU05279.1 hypothetical protein AYY16_19330 [Morganella psychrotolerans]